MIVGIDLTWVKPQKSGGIESFARNLLDGISIQDKTNRYTIFLSIDNYESFLHYAQYPNFKLIKCKCFANKVINRLLWLNLHFNKILKTHNIKVCLTPFYSKPLIKNKSCKTITVIHDLQAWHFPEYFSKNKVIWLKFAWKQTLKSSDIIIAISNFVKQDIINQYGSRYQNKIKVIYNPIKISNEQELYDITKEPYFYTICSPYKHKNFKTLILIMDRICNTYNKLLPKKLFVTGMKTFPKEIEILIKEKNLENNICLTGYIDNIKRDSYIKNAKLFLFPSIFEGFGMPVVESLMLGTPVITTNKTSIPEVSCNKAIYVSNPTDVNEWICKIEETLANSDKQKITFDQYDIKIIANQYIELINFLGK